jgi:hypothetical protein
MPHALAQHSRTASCSFELRWLSRPYFAPIREAVAQLYSYVDPYIPRYLQHGKIERAELANNEKGWAID